MAESQHPAQPPIPQTPLPPAPVLPSAGLPQPVPATPTASSSAALARAAASPALSQPVPASPAALSDPSLPPPVREEPAPVRRNGGVDAVLSPFPGGSQARKVPDHAGGPFTDPTAPVVHGTDGFAIAGFVTGLIGMVVLAPVFSIVGLRRIRRTGDRGRSLAITGLVLTGCWLAVIALVAALAVWGTREANVGNSTPVANIRVGQCFDADLGKSTLLVAKIADCAGPHAGEAYATASATLTGLDDSEKDMSAAQSCAKSFQGFVGGPYDASELDIFFVVLQDKEVANGNVLCMLGTPGKQLTGSMRGTGR